MNSKYEKRLSALVAQGGSKLVQDGQRGLEKECLRITPDGLISRADHPRALGSALTHRFITTDYSEALLEFVTPPQKTTWATNQFLCDLHQFTAGAIDDEMLWPFSMPCRLRSEDDIPIARYGSSNVGRMKTIYRQGLGNRYGRYMQAIAGIHFNYSLPDAFWPAWAEIIGEKDSQDFRSNYYLGLVRNIRRNDWLTLFLFGASPAVCRSFLAGATAKLDDLDENTCYGPWATSLRMSDLGYQNRNQSALVVSANSLEEYVRDLSAAIVTPNERYAKLGLRRDGDYLQLNVNQLQIENEYYSTVRPKRVASSGERPTAALQRGGIEYVEFRALDLNPFEPVGISQGQQKFLEMFLLYCLIQDSPPIGEDEQRQIDANNMSVARKGREPGLELRKGDETVALTKWAEQMCVDMQPIGALLDAGESSGYADALDSALASIRDTELTPSALILRELNATGASFADYGLQLAGDHRAYFKSIGDDFNQHLPMLREEAADSLQKQVEAEASDEITLDEYLASYYA